MDNLDNYRNNSCHFGDCHGFFVFLFMPGVRNACGGNGFGFRGRAMDSDGGVFRRFGNFGYVYQTSFEKIYEKGRRERLQYRRDNRQRSCGYGKNKRRRSRLCQNFRGDMGRFFRKRRNRQRKRGGDHCRQGNQAYGKKKIKT